MSKSIARVVFVVLLSFGLIAATFPGVQSRLGSMLRKADANSAVNASLSVDNQTSKQGIVSGRIHTNSSQQFNQFNEFAPDSSHDCKSQDSSQDY